MGGRAEERLLKNTALVERKEAERNGYLSLQTAVPHLSKGESRVEMCVDKLVGQESMLRNVLVFFNMDEVILCWLREAT